MAYRHTLGVAASTLALAVSCLAGAASASAATPTSVPSAISVASERSSDLPSAAEIAAAKKDKDATNAMIARIEASLASSRTELVQAETTAAEAQESLLSAGEERDLRTAEAEQAVKQLEYAKQYLDQSQADLGAIASDIYRNGAGNSTLGVLLNSNDSNDLFYKAATIDTLSQQQVQSVNSATEAKALVSAWQSYADAAQTAAQEATANFDKAATTANTTLASYQDSVKPEQDLRDELIGNLAKLKDQDEAKVRTEVQKQEDAQQEAKLQETISASAATAVEPSESAAEIKPLSVEKPQELEVDESTAKPTVKPKTEANSVDNPASAAPDYAEVESKETEAPKDTEAPKEAEKPKESEAPKETQAPKETPKPKKTEAPKETQKPKKTEAPKPKKTEAPKKTQAPKEEAEIAPQSSRSYGAAISWALKTADDPSKYYVYGGNGPNAFDCSSFTQRAFGQSGISLPRTSTQQFFSAPQYVSLNELRPGDLVFSSSNGGSSFYHVAIYIGNGQVVHARNPSVGISTTPLSWVNNIYPKAARY